MSISRTTARPATVASLLLLLATAPAAAQRAAATPSPMRSDSLPADVVAAIYVAGPPEWLRLRVGALPPEIPPSIVPEGAEVLGSGVVNGQMITALLVRDSPEGARIAIEDRLLAAGWTRPSSPVQFYAPRGFVSSGERIHVQQQGLCGTSALLTHTVSPWPDGRALLRVTIVPTGTGYSVCNPVAGGPPGRPMGMPNDSIMPELQPPPGVPVQPRGSSGGNASWTSRAVVQQPAATADLLRHYAAQLRTAGWELVEEVPGRAVASQLWRRRVSEGTNMGLWHATLTVSEQAGGRRQTLHLLVEREGG